MQYIIRVMLVDDEYLAIEDLKTLIDWENLGFKICSTACSGRQALALFKENPVDLIITDISMPGINGISLIEQLKPLKNNLLFLLLTAYAEVDYMKQAFKLGVQDYLIKDEITPQLLCEKLSKIHDSFLLSHRQSYSFLQKTMRRYFNSTSSILPDQTLLNSWNRLLYCILTPDLLVPWSKEAAGNSYLLYSYMLERALPFAEACEADELSNLCAFPAYNNKIIILLKPSDFSSTNKLIAILHRFASNLTNLLKQQGKVYFSCFFSYIPMSLETIHADYFSRQKALRARYFLGKNTIEPLNSKKLYITNSNLNLTEDTLVHLYEESEDNLKSCLNHFFNSVIHEHNYQGLTQLIYLCFWLIFKHLPDYYINYAEDNLTDIHAVRKLIFYLLTKLYTQKSSSLSHETRKALAYIEAHYGEESLSIQSIANEVGLSSTHFSRIFKENMGETAWDYLTSLRMKRACYLLSDTNKKIYEIAEETGYSSPQYFSQVFFKQTGMKPLDYRRKKQS